MKPLSDNLITSAPLLFLVLGLAACTGEEFLGGSLASIGIIGLLALALIVYAILDLIKSPMSSTNKIIWGLIIWIVPFIGAIVYLVIGRK